MSRLKTEAGISCMEVRGVTPATAFLIGLEINTGRFKYNKTSFNADLPSMDSIIRVKIKCKELFAESGNFD
jgi:hypothetical protein